MTKREFMEKVIAMVEDTELKEFAQAEIEKMNARNAKRTSTPSKTQVANIPIKSDINDFFVANEGSHLASEIAVAIDITPQKANALLKQMVDEGVLTSEEVKVKGKGKQKSYSLAQSERRTSKRTFFFQNICRTYVRGRPADIVIYFTKINT